MDAAAVGWPASELRHELPGALGSRSKSTPFGFHGTMSLTRQPSPLAGSMATLWSGQPWRRATTALLRRAIGRGAAEAVIKSFQRHAVIRRANRKLSAETQYCALEKQKDEPKALPFSVFACKTRGDCRGLRGLRQGALTVVGFDCRCSRPAATDPTQASTRPAPHHVLHRNSHKQEVSRS